MERPELRCYRCEDYVPLGHFANLGNCPHRRGLVFALEPACQRYRARAIEADPPTVDSDEYASIPGPVLTSHDLTSDSSVSDGDRHYPETLARLGSDGCGDCHHWRSVGTYANAGRCPYSSGPVHRLAPVSHCPHFNRYERPPELFHEMPKVVGSAASAAQENS